jgi:predicted enzyme related to lactoylglutathione lyase
MAEGSNSWWEIDVADVDRAKQFYGSVLPAWTLKPMEGFEGYVIVEVGGAGIGAIQASEDGNGATRGVRLYFDVSDLEDTLARVKQGGGTVEQERMQIPGDAWIGTSRDPFGNKIGFVTTSAAK